MTVFISDPRYGDQFVKMRHEMFPRRQVSCKLLITVSNFAQPGFLLKFKAWQSSASEDPVIHVSGRRGASYDARFPQDPSRLAGRSLIGARTLRKASSPPFYRRAAS